MPTRPPWKGPEPQVPPPSPVLVQILHAAAERLEAIEAGDAYFSTPKAVFREFVFLDAVNDLPVFIVLPWFDEEDATARDLGMGETGGTIDAVMSLGVLAYGEGTSSKTVSDVCLELLADAEVALTTPDFHLGLTANIVEDIQNTRRSAIPPDLYDPDRRGAMGHVYRVRYLYEQGVP